MADGQGAAKNNPDQTTGRDKAKGLAVKALRRMHEIGMAPTPQNFATWYAYFEGSNTALTAEVDRLEAQGGSLGSVDVSRLHDTYLVDAEREGLDRLSSQMEETINTLMADVGRAEEGARAYGETLTGLTGELQGGDSAGLQAVVANVLEETRRMAALNRMLEDKLSASSAEIQKLRNDLEVVREEANTDALTGLPNRKCFDRTFRQRAVEAGETGVSLCLLVLDIDHFKSFNDTHGHQTGDQVLRLVAKTVQQTVPQGCLPARLGGEEFAVLVPRLGFVQALQLADTVRRAVGGKKLRNLKSGETLGTITLSVGVAEYRVGEPLDRFFERADEALYLAKSSGRNRVCHEGLLSGPAASASG